MTTFDPKKALYSRTFYRFTGPPENWLTALKFMTWGLEEKYRERWKQILPGDVFLMHSKADSLFSKEAVSRVVGLGVVGGALRVKKDYLWVQEIREQQNRWPLLVPFSEIYLFSETLPDANSWEAPGMGGDEKVGQLIAALLEGAVPTHVLDSGGAFPVMGSISRVRGELVQLLFSMKIPSLYREFYDLSYSREDLSQFYVAKDAESIVRHVPSLKFLEGSLVKARKLAHDTSVFERDNILLEKAEESHARLLQSAIGFFRKRGFDVWWNQHVDLLAQSKKEAFLLEAKSTIHENFRPQARRAIGQLFEYEHFDVRWHFEKRNEQRLLSKVLMVSGNPKDSEYSGFLNGLKVHVVWPQADRLHVSGDPGPLAPLVKP